MDPLSRRSLLRGGAAGVVALSAADVARAEALATSGALDPAPEDATWAKAPCRYCGAGCGVEVAVKDEKVVAVRGDTKAEVNKGLLCVKGYHLPAMLYGDDRLLYPQRRKPDGIGGTIDDSFP